MINSSGFVSRAGAKIEAALDAFLINPTDFICADFGCSTGGFTECLLVRGAAKVYAVDTAYGELAWKLRTNPQVITMERTNALNVILPELCDLIVVDTGWTRQSRILPAALKNLKPNGTILALLKPHYEAEKHMLMGGKLKPEFVEQVVAKVMNEVSEIMESTKSSVQTYKVMGPIESPIVGDKAKNKEFLFGISLQD
jgi:23S rRNA (cytidine1920-2'-O)/16S rRNA (cytidine1409-2'-O)-methyltransferase